MATFFALNSGSYVTGTTQIGNLIITSDPTSYPGFTWWGDVSDNTLSSKYVLCRQVTPRRANALLPEDITVNFGFLGSTDKTDASYLALVNQISGQNFTVVQDATNWLNINGYWTSQGSSNITDVLTDGLVLKVDASNASSYPGTGTTWYDLSGNDYDGTLTNGASYSSEFGGVMIFTGSLSQYVTFGDPVETRLTSSNAVTYQIWVNGESGSAGIPSIIPAFNKLDAYGYYSYGTQCEMYLFGAGTDADDSGIYTYIWNATHSGDMSGQYNNDFSPLPNFHTGTLMTTGSWYFITVTAQLGTTIGTLYNNNQLYSGQHSSSLVPNFENSASLELGRTYNEPTTIVGQVNSYLNGKIGAFYVYNRQLSQSEITSNFNATKARYGY